MAGSMSYHMEARLKQDRINRWNEQKRHAEVTHQGLEEKHEDVAFRQKMGKVLSSDPGQFNQIRTPPLIPFRVNQEGFNNRFQKRQHLNPHVDKAFVTIYAGKDNFDYSCNENQVHRRLNSAIDKYQVCRKVNGDFILQHPRETQAVAR
ncbi:uncharacterized protein LOC143292512 isoform X1 [Babylonia areolata]|uniref:uncharacterized protein LOC143292512 isoform X1 n=1 Tax=Babylonia areolata TaxID=304850 RepID=UPI003FD4B158